MIAVMAILCLTNLSAVPETCRVMQFGNSMFADARLVMTAPSTDSVEADRAVHSYPAYIALHHYQDFQLQRLMPIRYIIGMDKRIHALVCQ
jgi:hypothetical protein